MKKYKYKDKIKFALFLAVAVGLFALGHHFNHTAGADYCIDNGHDKKKKNQSHPKSHG